MIAALLAWSTASATQINLTFTTPTGVNETASWEHTEMFRKEYGPVQNKKASAVYSVSVPSAVFDPVAAGFRVEASTCVEWSLKGKNDRYCERDVVLVPQDGAEPAQIDVTLKGKVKFQWTIRMTYTGAPPVPILETPPPEPPSDADPMEGGEAPAPEGDPG
ncbi:MAG: hypothetical protein R3F59_19275 [Myxococcota bacterium]